MGEHLPYKQRVIGSSPIVSIEVLLLHGLVVQLVRTLACHARGQGFEPPSGRQIFPYTLMRRIKVYEQRSLFKRYASVAQSVEQGTENPCVGGSIPPRGTTIFCWRSSIGRAADL